MSTLIEQLLLDDPSQAVKEGYFFENSLEGIGIIIDRSDEYINNKVFNKVFDKLVESSEHLKEILNTHLSKVRNINIEFSSEVPEEFRDRKEELVIDSFYYQINFNVDFILDYFENISIIYLKICPSFKCSKSGRVLDIGVTGYLCYESSGRISRFHQEKLSFKPRTKVITQDLFLTKVKNLPIWITNIFKYNNDYNGMFSLFKKEIAEKLAQLINVD